MSTTVQNIFTTIYTSKTWGNIDTVSGEGSTFENTHTIRAQLPKMFKLWNVNSVVDAGCGDYFWFSQCPAQLTSYTGVDVVQDLIQENNRKFGSSTYRFLTMNLCTDVVPKADMILCRDCLMHLSFEDAFKALKNFKQSGSKYLLVTTNPENPGNVPIKTGEFHHLNLTKTPFNFPEPITMVNENYMQYGGMFKDKSLGLWLLEDLKL
jgi:hypothetical protein